MPALTAWALAFALALEAPAMPAAPAAPKAARAAPADSAARRDWPDGTEVLRFENLDGVVLIEARLQGAVRDTTGPMVLDTGAGYVAIDAELAQVLGVAERAPVDRAEVALAARPLGRLELGRRQFDAVSPLLTIEADVVRRVTDRPVLGLLGQSLFAGQALWLDYSTRTVALIPLPPADSARRAWKQRAQDSRAALRGVIASSAVAVPFELVGDGKVIVVARLADPRRSRWSRPLRLALDTGATKTVLFESSIAQAVRHADEWPALRGASAPTLFGTAEARVARIPELELSQAQGGLRRLDLDVAILGGDLGDRISHATGITVHGLLGYSFLKHYRVCLDSPRRVLWLEPHVPDWEDRPFEYSHPGIQVERENGAARVVAVVTGSPADEAGIAPGDELLAVDGRAATTLDIVPLGRLLEGEPGTIVELTLRRDGHERNYRITRRRLL